MKKQEYYLWAGSITSPSEYPVVVYKGALVSGDFSQSFDVIWSGCDSGWGVVTSPMGSSDHPFPVPDSLYMSWYSVVEDKFYRGRWALDKERITRLFREGFWEMNLRKEKSTYNTFGIGLAPGGRVCLWLKGIGYQTEVGYFKAQEFTLTEEEVPETLKFIFRNNRDYHNKVLDNTMKEFKPEVWERIKQKGFPDPRIYDQYRRRYLWKPVLNLPQGSTIKDFGFTMLNGEMYTLFKEDYPHINYQRDAIPKNCGFYWFTPQGVEHGVRVFPFDQDEMFQAFSRFTPDEKVDLVFNVHDKLDSVQILLKSKDKEIELKKMDATIFKSRYN